MYIIVNNGMLKTRSSHSTEHCTGLCTFHVPPELSMPVPDGCDYKDHRNLLGNEDEQGSLVGFPGTHPCITRGKRSWTILLDTPRPQGGSSKSCANACHTPVSFNSGLEQGSLPRWTGLLPAGLWGSQGDRAPEARRDTVGFVYNFQ